MHCMLIHRIHKFLYSAGRNVVLNLKVKPCNSEWASEACLSAQTVEQNVWKVCS